MRPMTKPRVMIAVAMLSFGAISTVSAHSPLDDPNWCPDKGRLVVVDEFQWSGELLSDWIGTRRGDDSCSSPASSGFGTRTCGQFDDDWGQANALAIQHCDRFSVRFEGAPHPDYGTVVHIAEGPEAFNDEEAHHDRYRAVMGLHAMCIRCEPPASEPVGPIRSANPAR